ncbi:hypothetical protein C8R43DRAFT_946928 [Mycena crocata]|nr:hypothetical protein C8R43DRAFT_946928 [Mycena crocata]
MASEGGMVEEEKSNMSGAYTRRLPFTAVWRSGLIGPSGIIGFGGPKATCGLATARFLNPGLSRQSSLHSLLAAARFENSVDDFLECSQRYAPRALFVSDSEHRFNQTDPTFYLSRLLPRAKRISQPSLLVSSASFFDRTLRARAQRKHTSELLCQDEKLDLYVGAVAPAPALRPLHTREARKVSLSRVFARVPKRAQIFARIGAETYTEIRLLFCTRSLSLRFRVACKLQENVSRMISAKARKDVILVKESRIETCRISLWDFSRGRACSPTSRPFLERFTGVLCLGAPSELQYSFPGQGEIQPTDNKFKSSSNSRVTVGFWSLQGHCATFKQAPRLDVTNKKVA